MFGLIQMDLDPLFDENGRKETDVVAYILRRDWIGRAANICGMSEADIAYLTGHVYPDKHAADYGNPDVQRTLALQLERYVFLPEYSRNPYFMPTALNHDSTKRKRMYLEDYNGYRLLAENGTLEIRFRYQTGESGESIRIETNGTLVSPVSPECGPPDTPEKRMNRPLVGELHPRAYYEKLAEEAEEIGLKEFL